VVFLYQIQFWNGADEWPIWQSIHTHIYTHTHTRARAHACIYFSDKIDEKIILLVIKILFLIKHRITCPILFLIHFSSYEQSLSDVQRNSWTHILLWQYWYSGQLELLLQVGWQRPLIQSWSPMQSLVLPQSAANSNNQIVHEI